MCAQPNLNISVLGESQWDSPLKKVVPEQNRSARFIRDDQKIFFDIQADAVKSSAEPALLELAGPREKIFFNPEKTSAAITTCGGICPGINNVIRSLVMTLYYRYGVQRILGIPYGYEGFIEEYGHDPVELSPQVVTNIHKWGGTFLGTSRGEQDAAAKVDYLIKNKIDILFVIGGDGTQRGALDIAKEAEKRKMKLSVIGVPKTIDNDIKYMDQTFGFATAVSEAVKTIQIANTEAESQKNGIGLVKLMGRQSGFIACLSALAMNDANFVLIPEVPFDLEGKKGFLNALKKRLELRSHAVIIVSEGAGQQFFEKGTEVDASGNVRLKDIGLFLKDRINAYFKEHHIEVNLKYIDPSYTIRAIPASAVDSVYCQRLGQHAVHAAMSGRTKMVVAMSHRRYVHLPIELVASGRRYVDPHSDLWFSVLEATGQLAEMKDSLVNSTL